jgi:hypothetical protein
MVWTCDKQGSFFCTAWLGFLVKTLATPDEIKAMKIREVRRHKGSRRRGKKGGVMLVPDGDLPLLLVLDTVKT